VEWEYGLVKLKNGDNKNIFSTHRAFAKYGFAGKEEAWRDRLGEIMKRHKCTPQEVSRVMHLNDVPTKYTPSPHDYINLAVNMVCERLDRIHEIIDDHTTKPGVSR